MDPLFKLYPELTPYGYCNNSPIMYVEADGKGFNGGFAIVNKSTSPIIVVGTSKTISTNAIGEVKEIESPTREITLEPGQRLEVYYSKSKGVDGTTTEKFTAKVVQFAKLEDGKLSKP